MDLRRFALLICPGLVVAVACAVPSPSGRVADEPPPPGAAASVPETVETVEAVEAAGVLRAWDARRARAWATGDLRALSGLYTPASRTGRRDRAALASYVDRGLRVTGVRMQLLSVNLARRRDDRAVLRVTDRMTRAVALGEGRVVPLPRDGPSTWRVSMRRVAGEWRVAEVRRAPPRAPR